MAVGGLFREPGANCTQYEAKAAAQCVSYDSLLISQLRTRAYERKRTPMPDMSVFPIPNNAEHISFLQIVRDWAKSRDTLRIACTYVWMLTSLRDARLEQTVKLV